MLSGVTGYGGEPFDEIDERLTVSGRGLGLGSIADTIPSLLAYAFSCCLYCISFSYQSDEPSGR